MDVSIQKSRKGTQLNNTYYFRQPLPRVREHMKLLCILSKESKKKFSKYNLNLPKFQNTYKIHLHRSSRHIAVISYDNFDQNNDKTSSMTSLQHDQKLMKNDKIGNENENKDKCYDSEKILSLPSEIKNTILSKIDSTSSKLFSTTTHLVDTEKNQNVNDGKVKVKEQEKEICGINLDNINIKKENFKKSDFQLVKADKENLHYKQQLHIKNPNLIKERKKHLHINNIENISDQYNNKEEHNIMEKSWWRLIVDFLNFFSGKRDCNVNKHKANIKSFKTGAQITAKPGYPNICNAYKLSLDQNVVPNHRDYDSSKNVISKKMLKKKKKKVINNNDFNEKSKMRTISSPFS